MEQIEPTIVAKIEITMDDKGRVGYGSSVADNKILTYGMLAVAKEIAREAFKTAESRIVAPPPGALDFLDRRGK